MYILQVNYQVSVSRHTYEEDSAPVAESIANNVRGLIWKAWGYNEETGTACGLYLFEDEDALDCYLQSAIVKGLKRSPAFGDVTVNRFELLSDLSRVTHFGKPVELPPASVTHQEGT